MMQNVAHAAEHKVDISPFAALIGEDIVSLIFENAPRKVLTRVASALDDYIRAEKLQGIDEEMGAIRLIAAEEELVVAIFEWFKLHPESFPEHTDFVRKFRNRQVKLAFSPILIQFRFVIGDVLNDGFVLAGMESVLNWTARPIVDGKQI